MNIQQTGSSRRSQGKGDVQIRAGGIFHRAFRFIFPRTRKMTTRQQLTLSPYAKWRQFGNGFFAVLLVSLSSSRAVLFFRCKRFWRFWCLFAGKLPFKFVLHMLLVILVTVQVRAATTMRKRHSAKSLYTRVVCRLVGLDQLVVESVYVVLARLLRHVFGDVWQQHRPPNDRRYR